MQFISHGNPNITLPIGITQSAPGAVRLSFETLTKTILPQAQEFIAQGQKERLEALLSGNLHPDFYVPEAYRWAVRQQLHVGCLWNSFSSQEVFDKINASYATNERKEKESRAYQTYLPAELIPDQFRREFSAWFEENRRLLTRSKFERLSDTDRMRNFSLDENNLLFLTVNLESNNGKFRPITGIYFALRFAGPLSVYYNGDDHPVEIRTDPQGRILRLSIHPGFSKELVNYIRESKLPFRASLIKAIQAIPLDPNIQKWPLIEHLKQVIENLNTCARVIQNLITDRASVSMRAQVLFLSFMDIVGDYGTFRRWYRAFSKKSSPSENYFIESLSVWRVFVLEEVKRYEELILKLQQA